MDQPPPPPLPIATPASSSDIRIWCVLTHATALIGFLVPVAGHLVGPLIVWLAKRHDSPEIDAHGKESMNFQSSMLIFAFRRFENFRNFRKTALAHDEAKSIQPDFAFSDVFMPIHARAARRLGVVEMNRGEAIKADHAIKFAKCFPDRQPTADIVTGGENMRCVEANTKTLGLANIVNDVSKMLKPVSETRTLSGCRLER